MHILSYLRSIIVRPSHLATHDLIPVLGGQEFQYWYTKSQPSTLEHRQELFPSVGEKSATSFYAVLCWIHLVYCHPMVLLHFNCLRQIPTSYGLHGKQNSTGAMVLVGTWAKIGHIPPPPIVQTSLMSGESSFTQTRVSVLIYQIPTLHPWASARAFSECWWEICHILLCSFVLDPFGVLPPHGSLTLQLFAPDPNLLWLCRALSQSVCTFCILSGHSLWTSSAPPWHCGGQNANHTQWPILPMVCSNLRRTPSVLHDLVCFLKWPKASASRLAVWQLPPCWLHSSLFPLFESPWRTLPPCLVSLLLQVSLHDYRKWFACFLVASHSRVVVPTLQSYISWLPKTSICPRKRYRTRVGLVWHTSWLLIFCQSALWLLHPGTSAKVEPTGSSIGR